MIWDRAYSTLAEVLSFDAKGMIKAGAVVFPGNAGGEFDQFGLSELFAKARKERIGNFHRSAGHGVCVLEDETFQVGKVEIRAVARKISDLLGGDAARSTHGRADVDSKRTPDQRRNPQLSQSFQLGINQPAH